MLQPGALREAGVPRSDVLLFAGVAWPLLSRYIGKLPGDIVVKREGWTLAFPVVTCLILSAVLSLLLWLFRR